MSEFSMVLRGYDPRQVDEVVAQLEGTLGRAPLTGAPITLKFLGWTTFDVVMRGYDRFEVDGAMRRYRRELAALEGVELTDDEPDDGLSLVLGGEEWWDAPADPDGAYASDGAYDWSGVDGAYALDGPSGAEGSSGRRDADGMGGAGGTEGPGGSSGSSGRRDADGAGGTGGADGSPGWDGADGTGGAYASDGAGDVHGSSGWDGADGAAGADGSPAWRDADGAGGADGADGSGGAEGVEGAESPEGLDRAEGPEGLDRAEGVDGSSGPCRRAGAGRLELPQELREEVRRELSLGVRLRGYDRRQVEDFITRLWGHTDRYSLRVHGLTPDPVEPWELEEGPVFDVVLLGYDRERVDEVIAGYRRQLTGA